MFELIKTFIKPDRSNAVPIYPYDFNTSGFAHVDKVRSIVEDQSDWDYAFDDKELDANNISAAALFGFGASFSAQEKSLGDMLVKLNAGPHIMTYAWGMYKDIIKLETKSH